MASREISFLAFFLIWAKVQRWKVPPFHATLCNWLEHCNDPVRVLMVFRGASKSTIYAVYKAWKLYRNEQHRSLVWAADDKLATKLTRDTLNVLRRHPLCGGMLPKKPGAQSFWVTGALDARNASMEAVGVNGNSTGSRADDIDFDDIEIPKNIKTVDAREGLRMKIEESTHIIVPGGQKTYVGTPHTHDSVYEEQIAGGAAVLKIPLFAHVVRYAAASDITERTRFPFDFKPGPDGLYVLVGIGKFSRLLIEDEDYRVQAGHVVFPKPPGVVFDICAGNAWPERFTRQNIEQRRRDTRTLNGWDSQYQLKSKPVHEVRLDPAKLIPYDVNPTLTMINKTPVMMLGRVQIIGLSMRWDPSSGKLKSDVSAAAVVLQDRMGRRYWQAAQALVGELAEYDKRGEKITGGQVWQLCDLIEKLHVPRVTVETNGIGKFAPSVLRAALKQRRLVCGVAEVDNHTNKNLRILDAMEGPNLPIPLVAHTDVIDGGVWDQMKDWNPAVLDQPDDLLDAGAGAISDAPERVGRTLKNLPEGSAETWRPDAGVFEAELEL